MAFPLLDRAGQGKDERDALSYLSTVEQCTLGLGCSA
jgi:hypothetical protein